MVKDAVLIGDFPERWRQHKCNSCSSPYPPSSTIWAQTDKQFFFQKSSRDRDKLNREARTNQELKKTDSPILYSTSAGAAPLCQLSRQVSADLRAGLIGQSGCWPWARWVKGEGDRRAELRWGGGIFEQGGWKGRGLGLAGRWDWW